MEQFFQHQQDEPSNLRSQVSTPAEEPEKPKASIEPEIDDGIEIFTLPINKLEPNHSAEEYEQPEQVTREVEKCQEEKEQKEITVEAAEEKEEPDEEEEGMEMLDMLCDGVEAQDHAELKKKELKAMNEAMDFRLDILKMRKEDKK